MEGSDLEEIKSQGGSRHLNLLYPLSFSLGLCQAYLHHITIKSDAPLLFSISFGLFSAHNAIKNNRIAPLERIIINVGSHLLTYYIGFFGGTRLINQFEDSLSDAASILPAPVMIYEAAAGKAADARAYMQNAIASAQLKPLDYLVDE